MPVPVVNYAALPPAQYGLDLSQIPKGLMEGIQAYYMPKNMSADLQRQQLANALAKVNLQYAPQLNAADLAYKQAQTPYLQAQTGLVNQESQYYGPNIQSEINQRNAQTALTNTQNKYLPLDTLIKAMQSQNNQTRFGAAYQLSKSLATMPQAARDKWIADNQAAYADMLNTLGNKTLAQQANQGNDMLSNALAQYFPQLTPKPSQDINPNNGSNQFSSTPEQVANLSNISNIAANQSLTTAATRRQAEGARQVDALINDPALNQRAKNAFQYAGLQNMPKNVVDSLKRDSPQAYNDYLTFMNNDLPLLESRIKTLDQMGATDNQRKMLEDMFKKTMFAWRSDPQRAMQLFEGLKQSLSTVSQSVLASAQPVGNTGRYSSSESSSQKDLSQMSNEELMKLAGS